MVASKENQYIKAINASSSDVVSLNNANATNLKTSLTPKEIIKKLGAKVISKQRLENENLEIFYCFVENGKKINLQIANNGEFSIVGFPLILTGYWLFLMYKTFYCGNN